MKNFKKLLALTLAIACIAFGGKFRAGDSKYAHTYDFYPDKPCYRSAFFDNYNAKRF